MEWVKAPTQIKGGFTYCGGCGRSHFTLCNGTMHRMIGIQRMPKMI